MSQFPSKETHTAADKPANGLIITTQGLGKRFNREWIFKNFTFQFTPGLPYAVIGPNGSGKSTLLQVLWGQVPPTNGTIRYFSSGTEIQAEDICHYIAIATPYMDLIDEFTVKEQINFHFKLKRIRESISATDLLDIMYLTAASDKLINNLSSGMRQRLKLALAFYTQSDVIFLDEPGTNLDERAFAWYKQQLLLLPTNRLQIIASNNSNEYSPQSKIIDLTIHKGMHGTDF